MIDPVEILRVEELLTRMAPRIRKWVETMFEKDGHTVTLSVSANISTSLMANALVMVNQHGGDVDEFVRILMQETYQKYLSANREVEATRSALRTELGQSDWETGKSLH